MTKTEIEKALENATEEEILALVLAMERLAILLGKTEIKKQLIRKLDERLQAVEKLPLGFRKSLQGQDSDSDGKKTKWPSFQE